LSFSITSSLVFFVKISTFCHKSVFCLGDLWRKFSIKEQMGENLNDFLFLDLFLELG